MALYYFKPRHAQMYVLLFSYTTVAYNCVVYQVSYLAPYWHLLAELSRWENQLIGTVTVYTYKNNITGADIKAHHSVLYDPSSYSAPHLEYILSGREKM